MSKALLTEKPISVAPQETMFGLIGGFWIARSIHLAAKLGLADHFDDALKLITQLATERQLLQICSFPEFMQNTRRKP